MPLFKKSALRALGPSLLSTTLKAVINVPQHDAQSKKLPHMHMRMRRTAQLPSKPKRHSSVPKPDIHIQNAERKMQAVRAYNRK